MFQSGWTSIPWPWQRSGSTRTIAPGSFRLLLGSRIATLVTYMGPKKNTLRITLTGWWFQPFWKILVNWDDYSQYMEKQKMFQTTKQLKNPRISRSTLVEIWKPWVFPENEGTSSACRVVFDGFFTRKRSSWILEQPIAAPGVKMNGVSFLPLGKPWETYEEWPNGPNGPSLTIFGYP